MFKKISILFLLIFVAGAVLAWTPPSNINLQDYYNITGAPYINATTYYGNASQMTGTISSANSSTYSNYSTYSNSSTYWGNYLVSTDLNNLLTLKWTNLTDYPVACPAYSSITQLDDSITCTDYKAGYFDVYTTGNFNGSLYAVPVWVDSSASDSNSLFQVISDTRGTPQFQIQDGGANQASFITRSFMVVNQNNTLLNSSQNNICSDWGFNQIDCNTSTTGADFGVTDDIQALGLIYGSGLRA